MNSEPYLVSIIIPVYNVSKYIARCARSLFEQSYQNIEYVFVDDCSPDDSISILMSVLEHYPKRMDRVNVVKNITNCGIAAVRNIGVKHCHGSFLMYVDSDDWLDTDVVEKCVGKQLEEDADIIVFDRKIYKNDGVHIYRAKEVTTAQTMAEQMLARKREISIWGMLIRTSLYRDNNIACREGINMSEDYQTSPCLVYFAKNVAVLHDTYYNYENRNMTSISARFSEKNTRQELVTIDILGDFVKDKEPGIIQAYNYGRCIQLCYYRHNAAYYKVWSMWDDLNEMLKEIPVSTYSQLPLPYRIGWHIKSKSMLHIYVTCLKFMKKITSK